MAGRMISGAAALAELVRAAGDTETAGLHRMLPVVPELSILLPGRGLRRGSTVAIAGGPSAATGGGTSLLLALLAEASRSGSWCAVVGVPALGAVAAAESGVALDRLALVPHPGPDWPTVVAALIDGVDLVVTAVPGGVSGSIASRLVARARQRGSVLVPFGDWSGADVTLRVVAGRWEGLGAGHGRLRRRQVTVLARGRGAAARPKEATMWMPGVTIRPITLPPTPGSTDRSRPNPAAAAAGGTPAPATGRVPAATAQLLPATAAPRAEAPGAGPHSVSPGGAGPHPDSLDGAMPLPVSPAGAGPQPVLESGEPAAVQGQLLLFPGAEPGRSAGAGGRARRRNVSPAVI